MPPSDSYTGSYGVESRRTNAGQSRLIDSRPGNEPVSGSPRARPALPGAPGEDHRADGRRGYRRCHNPAAPNDLSSRLGASFFVDNRSGAGNTLGSREAARSDPDGYTLLMSSASGQVISPLVYKAIDYDPVRSFEPIGLIAEGSIILVVDPLQRWRLQSLRKAPR